VAGNAAHVRTGRRQLRRGSARSRRRRIRDNLVNNLISYCVWSTYLGLGFALADSNGYLDIEHASSVMPVISAVAAVLLWPLVFVGASLRV
jgi:hypothetical protein